jgi:hypothetical protein
LNCSLYTVLYDATNAPELTRLDRMQRTNNGHVIPVPRDPSLASRDSMPSSRSVLLASCTVMIIIKKKSYSTPYIIGHLTCMSLSLKIEYVVAGGLTVSTCTALRWLDSYFSCIIIHSFRFDLCRPCIPCHCTPKVTEDHPSILLILPHS